MALAKKHPAPQSESGDRVFYKAGALRGAVPTRIGEAATVPRPTEVDTAARGESRIVTVDELPPHLRAEFLKASGGPERPRAPKKRE